jgi:hypothetical protein
MAKELTGLPELETGGPPLVEGFKKMQEATICQTCKEPARIVSNSGGVRAYCNKCKTQWPITAVPLTQGTLPVEPRGLRKSTLVEPDWSKAWEK